MGALIRPLFSRRNVLTRAKVRLFEFLIASKHLYNVHTRSWMTQRELQHWENGLKDLIRVIACPLLAGIPAFRLEVQDLYGLIGALPPRDQLHVNRLRYFARMVARAPVCLWQYLLHTTHEHSWTAALTSSFTWLQTFAPKWKVPPPDEFLEWVLFVQTTGSWKGIVKSAARSCLTYRQQNAQAKVWQMKVDRTLTHLGATPMIEPLQVSNLWTCTLCEKSFWNKRALAMHAYQAHQYRTWTKHYMAGSLCLACGHEYFVRARALLHLHSSSQCSSTYAACMPPMSREAMEELEGWHPTKALLSSCQVPMPLLPPPGTQEAATMKAAWAFRFGPGATDFEQLQGCLLGTVAEDSAHLLRTPSLPLLVTLQQGVKLDMLAFFKPVGSLSQPPEFSLRPEFLCTSIVVTGARATCSGRSKVNGGMALTSSSA